MAPRIRRHGASVVLERELRRAWFRYLAETRAAALDDYVDVEEQAWRRLVSNLHALGMPIDHADCPSTVDVRAGTQRVEA